MRDDLKEAVIDAARDYLLGCGGTGRLRHALIAYETAALDEAGMPMLAAGMVRADGLPPLTEMQQEEPFHECLSDAVNGGLSVMRIAQSDAVPTPVAAQATHPDDAAVDRFAAAMKEKLSVAREKGRSGWENMDPAELSLMLRQHVEKGDPRDVANFCMFLWALGERIGAMPIAAQASEPESHLAEIAEALGDSTLTSYSQVATGIRDLKDRLAAPQPTAEAVLPVPLTVSQAPNSQYAKGWNDCVSESKAMNQQCTAEAVRNAAYEQAAVIVDDAADGASKEGDVKRKREYEFLAAGIRALQSAPPQPAEQLIGVEDMVRLSNRIQASMSTEQPSAAPGSEQLRREFNKGWNAAMGANEAVKNGTDPLAAIAKASAAPAALTLDSSEVEFLAARLRRLFGHFKYPLPGFAASDEKLIGIAPACIGGMLANLNATPAESVAQGLTDEVRQLLSDTRDAIDTLPGYPKGADVADRIDALLARAQGEQA